MADGLINLSIAETGDAPGQVYNFHVRVGETVLASNQFLTIEQSERVRELSREYDALFEHNQAPKATEAAQAAIGSELFSIWLAPFWGKLAADRLTGVSRQLLISSSSSQVLNLPWELLRPPQGEAIGIDGKWILRRLPETDGLLGPAPKDLPPGPLRVLYMVAAPTDQAELDFEKEEELLLRALSRAGHEAAFDSGDLGTFDELEQRVSELKPHLVHLTGHGVACNETSHFAFEDEHGNTDLRSASEIGQLFAGQGVQCAFISACQAGRAPSRNAQNGLAQGLLREGVPLVIGWSASVLDDVAIEVGARFYREVANGRTSIDRALISARQHARREFADRSDPSWSLPILYSATQQDRLFDPNRAETWPLPSLRLEALPGMSEEGFTPHFIGRRRELQQLLPALRTGDIQLAILTGIGGAGKSTLATRIARKLEAVDFAPIAISSSEDAPLSAAALLETCGDAFLMKGLKSYHARLWEPSLDTAQRLRLLVNMLNEQRFVVLLDNFESNLDEGSRQILDPEISAFYKYLIGRLQGKSRAIITSRYLPADASLPQRTKEWQLGEFGEAAFLKFMLRNVVVEKRYREGELPHALLLQLHRTLGGTPRFLGQIRKLLETISAGELRSDLDDVMLPSTDEMGEPGALQAARDAYCEKIFTARLYGRLGPTAQQMLRRTAVLSLAVPVEGLSAIGDVTEEEARAAAEEASRFALMHSLPGEWPVWSVYATLRSWLVAPERMPEAERRLSHLRAGDYLDKMDCLNDKGELWISPVVALQERRTHYIAAGALDKARNVTDSLSSYFIGRGLYGEVTRINQEILKHEGHTSTLFWIGSSYIECGEYAKSRIWFERSLELAQRTKDVESEAKALHQLASIYVGEGNYEIGRKMLRRTLRLRRQAHAKVGEATTLVQLASIDIYEGRYKLARRKLRQVLSIATDSGHLSLESAGWHQLGTIDYYEGRYGAARDKFSRALVIAHMITDPSGEYAALAQLAALDMHEGDFSAARGKLEQALTVTQAIGDRAGEGAIWHQLASIELEEENYPAARNKFARSLTIKQEIGDRAGEGATWHQLGFLAFVQGAGELALRFMALSWILHAAIGHGQAASAYNSLIAMATTLKYQPNLLEDLIREVQDAYIQDRGAGLLQRIQAELDE